MQTQCGWMMTVIPEASLYHRKQCKQSVQAGAKQEKKNKVHTKQGNCVEACTPSRSLSWVKENSEARKAMKVHQ